MNLESKFIPAFHEQYGWIKEIINCVSNRTKYTKNEIRIYESGICEIDVYDVFGNYKNTGIFSESDLPIIKKYKWYQDNTGYLSTTISGKKVRMHRLLFPNTLSDHYDNNKLNNTRENLQQISHSINIAKITNHMYNKEGVTGIFFTPYNTWQASIEINKTRKTKNFKTKKEAILMRYIWELNNWGINAPQLEKIEKEYPQLINAIKQKVKINENVKLVLAILSKLSQDEHCPCRISRTEDTKCMCKEFRKMIDNGETGMCHCGLYIIEEDN